MANLYLDRGAPAADQRVITRHKVSLSFLLPSFYREKIRSIPGVVAIAPLTWFGGRYKDDKPENAFSQMATDPEEYLKVASDKIVPPEQAKAWIHDQAGAMVDVELAKKFGWKIGDRITLQGSVFEVNPELTIRAIYTVNPPARNLYFNQKYIEEAVPWFKGKAGFFDTRMASAGDVPIAIKSIDELFHNSPEPTKTETEQAFKQSFIAMLGNVKAFILSICAAVVFAILLVSANTMAMAIRSRTREVAVLKTLGFTRQRVLTLFVAESVALSAIGGILGIFAATLLLQFVSHSQMAVGVTAGLNVTIPTMVVALLVAATVGIVSGSLPAYNASRIDIVEGLRHIG